MGAAGMGPLLTCSCFEFCLDDVLVIRYVLFSMLVNDRIGLTSE